MTALCFFASPAYAADEDDSQPEFISTEITCKTGDCPRLQHLTMGLRAGFRDYASFEVAWDPGHVEKPTWQDTAGVLGQRLPPRKTWFDHFALRVRATDAIEVSIEDWAATTLLPDASGLSFAHALQDSGWTQTALRISGVSNDNPINTWTLVAGFGEGERFREQDHKPYVGLMLRRELRTGFEWQAGWSYDPESAGKAQFYWLDSADRKAASSGYKTERAALALVLNGLHPNMRGIRASVGFQRNRIEGPETRFTPPLSDAFDPTEIRGSRVERQTIAYSASYQILGEYLLALHRQDLKVRVSSADALQSCEGLDANGACIGSANSTNALSMREQTFGIGRLDEDGWSLFLESFSVRYDRLYELYHFAPEQNRRQRGVSFAQLRFGWTW